MSNTAANQFDPNYVIHPGEILEETLEARGIKKAEFAKRCGLSAKTISQIINGKAPVSPEIAIQFERVLSVSAAIWNNLEALYRLHTTQMTTRKKLERQVSWANKFPKAELVRRGIIEKPDSTVDAVEKLLNFFAVGSIEAWGKRFKEMSVDYRRSPSFKSAPEAVATWLRLGELYSESIDTYPFSKVKFNDALQKIRCLTFEPPDVFNPKMKELCRKSGVALVFVREFPKTHLSGATRWLNKDKALIMLSLRHKSDDHLWFSFFHEAAHVLIHGKKKVYLDEEDMASNDDEKEADIFASNILIPEQEYAAFTAQGRFSRENIKAFANKIRIAPGIIVGRLQHDKHIPYAWLNPLKRKFEWG